jgi:hypothetical protein
VAQIDLREFREESLVIHFGGETGQIDALTFGNALISVAEALRAINHEVNPGYALEIRIEAIGPGSFRATLRTAKRSLKNLFSGESFRALVIGIFATFLYDKVFNPDSPPIIKVNDDMVIIEYGDDRVIVPKEVFEKAEKVADNPAVNQHVSRTMEVLESDPSVTSFGITRDLSDPKPLIDFPREAFSVIRQNSSPPARDGRRFTDHDAVLSVHKAVFQRSPRKWEFVWNGFRISAPILDDSFFDRLEAREISIRQGDAYQATLRVYQVYDSMTGTWVNESYEVLRIGNLVSRPPEQGTVGF